MPGNPKTKAKLVAEGGCLGCSKRCRYRVSQPEPRAEERKNSEHARALAVPYGCNSLVVK